MHSTYELPFIKFDCPINLIKKILDYTWKKKEL